MCCSLCKVCNVSPAGGAVVGHAREPLVPNISSDSASRLQAVNKAPWQADRQAGSTYATSPDIWSQLDFDVATMSVWQMQHFSKPE